MAQTRLKSSFIYLANAVNDLRGNWAILAIIIAPLALAASLCLLPDALNLQHRLVQTFENSGGQTVSFVPAQVPLHPEVPEPGPPPPLYPVWFTRFLHALSLAITIGLSLIVLCASQRMQAGTRAPDIISEAIAIYRRAIPLVPAFALIVLLQLLATIVGIALLVVPGLLVYVWLYFSRYALVFEDRHSWHALLFSRDLMRGRFFKVATRVLVFLIVWSGYNSWAATVFVIVSLLLGPVGVLTNSIAATIFMIDLLGVVVTYSTAAFFVVAGVRLYQDLVAIASEEAAKVHATPATVPLSGASA
ncbi:MAG: hypothetical protein ACLQAT_03055 [Candidatus Binataceae bacterium]